MPQLQPPYIFQVWSVLDAKYLVIGWNPNLKFISESPTYVCMNEYHRCKLYLQRNRLPISKLRLYLVISIYRSSWAAERNMIILWSPQNVISNLACYKWLPNERSISKIAAAELKNDDDRHSHDWMANTVTHLWNRTLAVVDRWQLWISNGFWMGKWSCTLRLTVKWVVFLLFVVCAKSFIIFVTLIILEKGANLLETIGFRITFYFFVTYLET